MRTYRKFKYKPEEMKDYNQEYFFLRRKGNNIPSIDFVNWPDGDIKFLKSSYTDDKVIPFKFREPIPKDPQFADLHACSYKMIISERIKEQLETLNLRDIQLSVIRLKKS